MKRFQRMLIAVGVGVLGLLLYGLLDKPRKPAPPSTFWKESIPSQIIFATNNFSNAIADARSTLVARMKYFGTPGLSVAIAVRHELVWAECFGYSDIQNRSLIGPFTKFRVGSVSKPFTTAAVAKLWQESKLDLDAPAHNYLPGFPRPAQPFTVRQLAAHLAGIGKKNEQPFLNTNHYHSVSQALAEVQNAPLLFPPGTKFHYSGGGYTILSAIIEAVAARDFLSAVDELVFRPLHMTNTCADRPGASNVTVFYDNYTKRDRLPELAPFHDHSRSWAAGGFLSTPLDLINFGNAFLSGSFLKAETIATLLQEQKTTGGKDTGYGLGWALTTGPFGLRQVRHFGDTVGGQAFLVLFPEAELVIALACTGNFWNYHGDGASGATHRLAEIFLQQLQTDPRPVTSTR